MLPLFTPIIYVLTFVAVAILAQTIAGAVFGANDRSRRVNRRLTMLESGMNATDVYTALSRQALGPRKGDGFWPRLQDRIETITRHADLKMSLWRLMLVTVAIAVVLWAISLVILGVAGKNLLLNGTTSLVAASAIALLGVYLWVSRRRKARLKKIEEQLPLALDVVTRAVRAGHPVIAAVQLAANEMGDPIGSEFGLMVDETTYGGEFKEALSSFAWRTGSPDAHFFAVSVSIQSETGGNLAEILEGLSNVMRARNTLGKKVKALASEGKASAYILSALPVGLVAFQMLINPTFYTSKFSDPIFWPATGGVLVLYVLGWIVIQRIINFKY